MRGCFVTPGLDVDRRASSASSEVDVSTSKVTAGDEAGR